MELEASSSSAKQLLPSTTTLPPAPATPSADLEIGENEKSLEDSLLGTGLKVEAHL